MSNNIIVVKLGGTEGVDFLAICQDAAVLLSQGQQLVLVHGGTVTSRMWDAVLAHLENGHDRILGELVEDHGRHGEVLLPEPLDVGVHRQQAVLAVDGAQDALALRHLERPQARPFLDGHE